jgi:hypothetical protein
MMTEIQTRRSSGSDVSVVLTIVAPCAPGRFGRSAQNLDNLRERVHGGDFKPFKLHLSDGRELSIPHPDFILVSRKVVVVATEEGVTYTIDPFHIVAISNQSAAGKPS